MKNGASFQILGSGFKIKIWLANGIILQTSTLVFIHISIYAVLNKLGPVLH